MRLLINTVEQGGLSTDCFVSCRHVTRAQLHVVGMLRFVFGHKPAEITHSFLFCSWRLLLSLRPFQLYFVPYFFPTTLHFLILFFRSYFCLIIPFKHISLPESLPKVFFRIKASLFLVWFLFSS